MTEVRMDSLFNPALAKARAIKLRDARILLLWRAGCDTAEIARLTRLAESVVYNVLSLARGTAGA
jgi:DNA-binding CsgD family transcriptional regulator